MLREKKEKEEERENKKVTNKKGDKREWKTGQFKVDTGDRVQSGIYWELELRIQRLDMDNVFSSLFFLLFFLCDDFHNSL